MRDDWRRHGKDTTNESVPQDGHLVRGQQPNWGTGLEKVDGQSHVCCWRVVPVLWLCHGSSGCSEAEEWFDKKVGRAHAKD
jgi:hypothetical protein